ncbi:MAG: D-alanyl-D-alanine carboxypeptidase/D-alanyl-D-alanine-endopeptidase [Pseudomonadota bacterium]
MQKALSRFNFDGSGLSILVHKIGDNKPLLEFNPEKARNPASVIKMLTTLVALEELGPAHAWRTEFYSDADVVDGVLNGDLVIKGGGDPYLPLERLWLMVRQLRQTGLSDIAGSLILDQSAFAAIDEDPAAFDNRPLRAYNVVPAALLGNFNVSRLRFTPDITTGQVQVEIDPPLPRLTIDNQLRLKDKTCGGYNRGIALSSPQSGTVVLEGEYSSRCNTYTIGRSLIDHNRYFVAVFDALWRAAGGQWSGEWREAAYRGDRDPLMVFHSPPLSKVMRLANKHSNNVMTRMIFLSLGHEEDVPANAQNARDSIDAWFMKRGIHAPELNVVNGAGSSRDVRVSANTLGHMLLHAWNSPFMPEFVASLSLGGYDGTLRKRYRNHSLAGRVHAKTGRLDHVIALAGFVQTQNNDRYIVVALHNATDIHWGAGQAVQDALLSWVYRGVN